MEKEKRTQIEELTLEEKAALCMGADFWHTQGVERFDLKGITFSDGPHGIRKQKKKGDALGQAKSESSVCFPAGCATATSFNRELIYKMGEALGRECQANDIGILLGPSMNIKRSPLCGRNFEYFSEDPYVSTEMGAALVAGIQSEGVGACPKHFLANNQETRRMTSSSDVDERTLREIYLASFEGAVKKSRPWAMMCAYNKINGVYAAESKQYLTEILRNEWGFDGIVVSDWGAVNDRCKDLEAGMDIEMPFPGPGIQKEIAEKVRKGVLPEEALDVACERILEIENRIEKGKKSCESDLEADHQLAKEVAEECIVLLKNDGILPLKEKQKAAFIGVYATEPRYQGGGSSKINSSKVTSAYEQVAENPNITFYQGFSDEEYATQEEQKRLREKAVEGALTAEVAVLFAGLPEGMESEGFDREDLKLPSYQTELIEAVCKVQKHVIVVLHNGAPVEMPWIDDVEGVLETYLGGQAAGAAVADILYGKVNPSGKLAETFPVCLEDTPAYLNFGGKSDHVRYGEGVFVGYRYYDSRKMKVLFPFGHGLSYTKFQYGNLRTDKKQVSDEEQIEVSLDITNVGSQKGKEIVQLYVSPCEEAVVSRPPRELKAFDKIELEPGETKKVTFHLEKRAFAYWDIDVHDWVAEPGRYQILAAASSRDIRCITEIELTGSRRAKRVYTLDSPLGMIMEDEVAREKAEELLKNAAKILMPSGEKAKSARARKMGEAVMNNLPIRNLMAFAGAKKEELEKLVEELNR